MNLVINTNKVSNREIVAASIAGFAAFWYAVGLRVLDVTNVRWLLVGDSAQAYLGWEFFRKTPLLQWPLGDNPNFGVGFNSTIVFADGIPLVSIILKPLSSWYEGDFQYFGWWLLTTFVLQALLTIRILDRINVAPDARLFALPIFLLQPFFLDRMAFEGYGHLALSAHWLILLGIWLSLRDESTHWQWSIALMLCIGVTFYFFVFVLVFYLAWTIRDVICSPNKRVRLYNNIRGLSLSAACSVLFTLAIGGFSSGPISDSGLGTYRATIASLFDKATLNGPSWSRISWFPDIANSFGSQEGFGFMGIAGLLLVALSLIYLRRFVSRFISSNGVMFISLGLLFWLISISPRIALGPREVGILELPPWLTKILSVVRSTGRMIWVPIYLILIASVYIISMTSLRNRKIGLSLLGILSVIHIVDTAPAVAVIKQRFQNADLTLITDDPRWDSWAYGKTQLVSIPPLSNDPRWIDLAFLAHRHDMSTNAAYVSRKNEEAFTRLISENQARLESREFDRDALYIITNYPPNPESARLLDEALSPKAAPYRIFHVEELTVVVP